MNAVMNPRVGSAHYPYKGPYTIGLHMANTTPLNADFDGDEMNIQAPQTEEAKAEMASLMHVHQCLMSTQTNDPTMGVVFNGPTAGYLSASTRIRWTRTW